MIAACNKANSPSQLEAQKLDEHFSHNLDPESEHTVSSVVGISNRTRILMQFEDKLNPATGYWDQNVYINNVLKSSISTSESTFSPTELRICIDLNSTGYGQQGNYFFVSIECASGRCANAPEHSRCNYVLLAQIIVLTLTTYRLGRHFTGAESARS